MKKYFIAGFFLVGVIATPLLTASAVEDPVFPVGEAARPTTTPLTGQEAGSSKADFERQKASERTVITKTEPKKKLNSPDVSSYDNAIGNNKVIRTIGTGTGRGGIKYGFRNLLNPDSPIIKIANYIFAAIALIWLSVVGGKFVLSGGEEEKQSKYKRQFGWIILGLLIISSAEYVAFNIFDPTSTGGLTNDAGIYGFLGIVKKIIVFLKYLIGAIALLAGIRSGFALIVGGEEDEVIQKEKEFVKIFLFAVALVLFAESLERWIDLSAGGFGIQADRIVVEIVGIINFILTFIAGAALFMLVLSSLYYVISFGDEETTGRAKKMIIASVVGLIIAYSAYTIVRFLV